MDQVSRPLLIALAATVALLVVWMVALRPKPVEVDNTPLAPTKAIPQAGQAAATADAANAQRQAGGDAPAAPAPPASATPGSVTPPAAAPATPDRRKAAKRTAGARSDAALVRHVRRGKVVVLLFWNAQTADDIATRGALRDLDRHDGKVLVRVVRIANAARYRTVTRGVNVAKSPTTVIIGRKGRPLVIAGLGEPRELSRGVRAVLARR